MFTQEMLERGSERASRRLDKKLFTRETRSKSIDYERTSDLGENSLRNGRA